MFAFATDICDNKYGKISRGEIILPRRKPQDLAFSDLLANTEKLSKAEMRKLITNYLKNNDGEMGERYERLVLTDLEKHLKELGINSFCPYCGSK